MITEIKSTAEYFSLNDGDYLFLEDAPLDFIYLIDEGEVGLMKLNKDEKIEFLSQVEGDLVGVDIFFKNANSDYSAIAKKACKLYKVALVDFQNILNHHKTISLELVKYMCSLISFLEKRA